MWTVETNQLSGNWGQSVNAPNLISFSRILLAPVVGWAILRSHLSLSLTLFAIAAATDFVDGYLARSSRNTTIAGQYLDPIADKILLCVVYVALGLAALVPWWFVGIVFGRDLALLVASVIAMKVSRYNDYRPTIWGKISTGFQILAAIAALAASLTVSHYLVILAAVATVWSAVHYTWRGVSFFFTTGKA